MVTKSEKNCVTTPEACAPAIASVVNDVGAIEESDCGLRRTNVSIKAMWEDKQKSDDDDIYVD